ncbi:caspase family protein [Streptomyces sp. TBY4]|uniref:VMAP-C domain-containing protein n=1 Tax=Streptomyces sp. TBY4 TaxID=2962030 RepID=UPI0020B84927|nr:caspase family protein [Streptomyces sp. TBY4]MCP3759231.1 caspase family protein [Streptomyces sp. TBY4]
MNPLDSLPPELGPRTFALVAGVERYDVSHHWNLRGPAADALRFARWLTGPGEVPPGHVRLLLSPLDDPDSLDWSGSAGMEALRGTHRRATEANVKSVLLDELPACDGDLLLIFWAGHGFVEPHRGELLLPCADAVPSQIRHLNLDAALRWWRTSLVKRELFRYQAALVDACRVDAPRDTRWNFGTNHYGGGATVPGRRQFRLYASREGEAAKNDAERGAGRFTEQLLADIGGRTVREAVSGLADTARSIHHAFQDLRDRGEGWQLPQFVVDRDWNASSFLDDDVPGMAPPRAGRLDQSAWDGLGELFEDRDLPRCAYEAYLWAFRAAGCAAPVQGGLPGDTLLEVAQDLDERHGGPGGMPLAVPFVRFLGEQGASGDARWAARVRDWVRATRERLGLPALPPPPPPPRRAALHVRLETPPGGEDGFLARMWLRREATEHIWESEGQPVGLDAVRDALVRELGAIVRTLGAEAAAGRPSGAVERIEFHVPYELLDLDFDQWPVPRGPGGRTRPLGVLHQVVVRCPQEREDTGAEWRGKWRWLWAQGGRHPEAVRVVADADAEDGLGMELGAGPAPACVLAHTRTGARTSAVVEAVLEGGVPVALWHRPAPGGAAGSLLDLLAPPGEDGRPPDPGALDVLALPARVRAVRREAAVAGAGAPGGERRQPLGGDRLVLLWDDPDDTLTLRSLA